ncbi:MAG: dephospho-CoA kinase [Actinomycetes bacterium]
MLAVGITGGIGAGKSALADLLVDRGALLIDADLIARDVVAPGSPVLDALVDRFGPQILTEHGDLDRQAVADVVFSDPDALTDLNAIVHPAIGIEMSERREQARHREGVCLLAVPLLRDEHRSNLDLDAVVVVDCPVEVAVDRLVEQRGFSDVDARARIAAQMTREERVSLGDYVVLNDGDLLHLEEQADMLWAELLERAEDDA